MKTIHTFSSANLRPKLSFTHDKRTSELSRTPSIGHIQIRTPKKLKCFLQENQRTIKQTPAYHQTVYRQTKEKERLYLQEIEYLQLQKKQLIHENQTMRYSIKKGEEEKQELRVTIHKFEKDVERIEADLRCQENGKKKKIILQPRHQSARKKISISINSNKNRDNVFVKEENGTFQHEIIQLEKKVEEYRRELESQKEQIFILEKKLRNLKEGHEAEMEKENASCRKQIQYLQDSIGRKNKQILEKQFLLQKFIKR